MFEKFREKFIHSPIGRVYLWIVAIIGALVSAFVLFWVLAFAVVLVRAVWDILVRINVLLSEQSWLQWPHEHIGYADTILESGLVILVIVSFITIKDYVKGSKYKSKRKAIPDRKTHAVEQLLPTTNRKLVLCIDGTNDFAAASPTHVYQVAEMLKGQNNVVVYYDGGVGTLADAADINTFKRKVYQGLDLAFGFSVRANVVNGYTFLVNNYLPGDEIYLFGFSRGAYGARVLGGVLGLFGLLEKTQENLIPFIWQTYNNLDGGWDQEHIEAMKKGMSLRPVKIAYIGVWDTVSTIGYLRQRTFPYTGSLPAVECGRHAVAIDEHRNMFPENLVAGTGNVEECWFAGVHRDVGGGGNQDANSLTEIPFRWVLAPLQARFDLKFTVPCDPTVRAWNQNDVMTAGYGIAGLFPQRIWTKDPTGGRYRWHWFRCWHVRKPQADVNIHVSVADRAKANIGYLPKAFLDSNMAPKVGVTIIGSMQELTGLTSEQDVYEYPEYSTVDLYFERCSQSQGEQLVEQLTNIAREEGIDINVVDTRIGSYEVHLIVSSMATGAYLQHKFGKVLLAFVKKIKKNSTFYSATDQGMSIRLGNNIFVKVPDPSNPGRDLKMTKFLLSAKEMKPIAGKSAIYKTPMAIFNYFSNSVSSATAALPVAQAVQPSVSVGPVNAADSVSVTGGDQIVTEPNDEPPRIQNMQD